MRSNDRPAAERKRVNLLRFAVPAMLSCVMLLPAPPAQAACAGFPDVANDGFCPNVEWIRNRQVTLGCEGGNYCPDQMVSRLQMAAFMNRLGNALTPAQVRVDAVVGAVDLDASPVVCQSPDFTAANFPRRVYVDLSLSATATADTGVATQLLYSTDAGGNWTPLNAQVNRGSVPANAWNVIPDLGAVDLDAGQVARFAVRLSRGGTAGTVPLADSRCQLRALVYSRTGETSPL